MLKKFAAVLSALSITATAIPMAAMAAETETKEIIHYDFDSVTNMDSNNKRWAYNKIDSNTYPLSVATATWLNTGHIKTKAVNDITYPEKTYIESWYNDWYQNIMTVTPNDSLKAAFAGGVSTDFWFKPIYQGDYYRRFVLMEAELKAGDPLLRVMYDANGDGAGNGRIIVTRKVTDGTKNTYNEYHFGKTLKYGEWHNIQVSLDESDGLNEPMVIVDGEKLAVYDPEKKIPTKDDGYQVVGYDNLSGLVFGRATEIGTGSYYNSHILFSDTSIYDGPRTEPEMLEDYYRNVGYYEPEYDIKVTDGLGALASKSGLDDVFAGNGLMPKITIDTSKVEGTDTALFNSENVTITDITANKQLNTTGSLTDTLYTVTSDEFVPGHKYVVAVDEAVSDKRSQPQTVEFATIQTVPEVVAQYNMNKTVNSENQDCIEDVVSGEKSRFTGTFFSANKYDDTYYVGADWAIGEAMSDNLRKALADEFTVDIWFKVNPNSKQPEERIWSVGRPESADGGRIHMMLNKKGAMLGFRVNYLNTDNTETYAQYLTTNTTNYYSNSGWNHLIFSYDTKTEAKAAVLNGKELAFDTKTYAEDASYRTSQYETTLPDGAKPYTMHEKASMFVNGTVNLNGITWGGFTSKYYIGKQTFYNKAASTTYMNYLAALDNDKYDTAYDITLIQGGKELEKSDLSVLAKGTLTAQIAIAKTDGFDGNTYIENANGEKIVPTISWNDEGIAATLTYTGLTKGEYKLVITKDAADSTGAKIRKTDYVLPLNVVGKTELSLLVNGQPVEPGTKVSGEAYALAQLVNFDETAPVTLIAAIYKDGKLVSVESTNEKIGENEDELGIYIENVEEGAAVKLMLWDNLNGMCPVIDSVEY